MRKTLLLGTVFAALAVGAPASAVAATDTTSVTLGPGTLSFSAAPTADDFPGVTLTGATQTITTNFNDWRVNDARGNGAGWNVTIDASQFSDGGSNTLPTSSLTLKPPVVTKVDLLNVALPPLPQGVPPWTIDSGTPVKIESALAGTGQGEWNFDQQNLAASKDLSLTVPADAAAGTYTSTITSTLSTGP